MTMITARTGSLPSPAANFPAKPAAIGVHALDASAMDRQAAVIVDLSPAGRAKGEAELGAGKAPGGLMLDSKGATYDGKRIAISDILANKAGVFTDKEVAAASKHRLQMEAAGFQHLNRGKTDPWSLKAYFVAYRDYMRGLPPEEQNSARYAGQMQEAERMIRTFDGQIASGKWDRDTGQERTVAGKGRRKGVGTLLDMLQAAQDRFREMREARQERKAEAAPANAYGAKYQALVSGPRTAADVLAGPDAALDPLKDAIWVAGTTRPSR